MAAGLETLRFVLFGDDRASSAFSRFARQVDDTTKSVDKNNLSLVESRAKLDLIDAKAKEIGQLNPDVKVQIDDYAAKLKLAVLKHELNDIGGSGGALGTLGRAGAAASSDMAGLSQAMSGLPGILGSIASTGPAGVAVLGAMAVAAAALVVALAPVAAALIPITIGIGGFAAIAIPELTKVMDALGKSGKAAHDALAKLTPEERDLAAQIKPLKEQFSDLAKAVEPQIMNAFGEAIKVIKDLMPTLKPLIRAAADALAGFLGHIDNWLKSPGGQAFVNWLKTAGPQDIKNFGRIMWAVAHGIGEALNQIYRSGKWIDAFLTHWKDDWILVKTSAQLQWDYIKIAAFKAVDFILGAFSHIPIIGGQFAKARIAIHGELVKIQADILRASNEFQNALNNIHGERVGIEFTSKFVAAHGVPVRAAGGLITGGVAGRDSVPGLLMPGEVVVPTRMVQAGAVDHLRGQLPGFAGGGLVGGWDIHDVFDPRVAAAIKMINAGTKAFQDQGAAYVQAHPFKYWNFQPISGGGGVPHAVSFYSPQVLRALAMLGQPSADIGVVLRQMQSESGGNPTIVNKWDSNWFAGHPSVGLMQVIRGTFDAYAGPFRNVGPFEYGVSVNPMANIYAGLNYAVHRYGAAWTRVLGQGHGYDQGGWLPPGVSLAYNGTGRPERVGGGGDVYNNITVNMPPGSDGADVVRALQKYAERNGPIRLRVRS
jgi:hypothetical protein